MGVDAVFRSWNIPRAVKYREINKITGLAGTAVNVQAMVYGNYNGAGGQSGTGVLFTRNPATGENRLYGEFLMDAQGEDVVAGELRNGVEWWWMEAEGGGFLRRGSRELRRGEREVEGREGGREGRF